MGRRRLLGETSDKCYGLGMNEIPEADVGGEQDDGNQHDQSRINQFLEFLESTNFGIGIPGPRCFAELGFDLTDEFEGFLEHEIE